MSRPVVMLYGKPGCHLCEAVVQVIALVSQERPIEFALRNILDDAADFERYRTEIPVVLLNGVEIARHRLSADELRAALRKFDEDLSRFA